MTSFLNQSFAHRVKNHATIDPNFSCELIDLENVYQDLLCHLQSIKKSDKERLKKLPHDKKLELIESNPFFLPFKNKLEQLADMGISYEVIANQLINTTLLNHTNEYFGPCYDKWENSITMASAAFGTCILAAIPSGVVGFALCSFTYGAMVLAADELYEECMNNRYRGHDPKH